MADTSPALFDNPLLKDLDISLPEPILLEHKATLTEVRKADIQLFNQSLRIVHAMWAKVETLPAALVMIDRTMKLIETRRHILGLEYGASQSKSSKSITWEPLS